MRKRIRALLAHRQTVGRVGGFAVTVAVLPAIVQIVILLVNGNVGAGVAVGALGAMMLPKNSDAYKQTKKAANAIRREAETAIDSISSMQ